MGTSGPSSQNELPEILRVLSQQASLGTLLATNEVADTVDCDSRTAASNLEALAEQGELQTKTIGGEYRIWWQPPAQPQADSLT